MNQLECMIIESLSNVLYVTSVSACFDENVERTEKQYQKIERLITSKRTHSTQKENQNSLLRG